MVEKLFGRFLRVELTLLCVYGIGKNQGGTPICFFFFIRIRIYVWKIRKIMGKLCKITMKKVDAKGI
jgi:hypothetical protein